MSADAPAHPPARQAALDLLVQSAVSNIPGADCASITLRKGRDAMCTLAATDPLARQADDLQYELGEGPCFAAITGDRFVLVNDMTVAARFLTYAPRAAALGVGAQAGIQLFRDGETAGLNLYARIPGAFDRGTVQVADLFATQAGALLGFATQVEQLSEALHTRTDIATAVGIVMQRYGIDRHRAFAFLARNSQAHNIKIRFLSQQLIDGSFRFTHEDGPAQDGT